jgi:hypothetical protein
MLKYTSTASALRAAAAIIGATILILACTAALGARMAHADTVPVGRPVALNVANSDPDYLRALAPRESVSKARQCGRSGFFTETSAYGARGQALGGQRWTGGPFPVMSWQGVGGRVVWDGLTFVNHTTRTVLVAAWCS